MEKAIVKTGRYVMTKGGKCWELTDGTAMREDGYKSQFTFEAWQSTHKTYHHKEEQLRLWKKLTLTNNK